MCVQHISCGVIGILTRVAFPFRPIHFMCSFDVSRVHCVPGKTDS